MGEGSGGVAVMVAVMERLSYGAGHEACMPRALRNWEGLIREETSKPYNTRRGLIECRQTGTALTRGAYWQRSTASRNQSKSNNLHERKT